MHCFLGLIFQRFSSKSMWVTMKKKQYWLPSYTITLFIALKSSNKMKRWQDAKNITTENYYRTTKLMLVWSLCHTVKKKFWKWDAPKLVLEFLKICNKFFKLILIWYSKFMENLKQSEEKHADTSLEFLGGHL